MARVIFRMVTMGALLFLVACNAQDRNPAPSRSVEGYYRLLDKVLSERKQKIELYLQSLQFQADAAQADSLMQACFRSLDQASRNRDARGAQDGQADRELQNVEMALLVHHVKSYPIFYDILFIDTAGNIFHTVLQEPDNNKSLLGGDLARTSLSQKIRMKPQTAFVDFQDYAVSDEPAAFFVEPVRNSDGLAGWFAFQVSINKLNYLLSDNEQLGVTGEVLLVNRNQLMLNDSRFDVKSTGLKRKLSDENIFYKFQERKGHKRVTDYRGCAVYTSFEVFEFMGTEWLLIAKMDEEEILTEIYKADPDRFAHLLRRRASSPSVFDAGSVTVDDRSHRVDMDEFQRTDSRVHLYTKSVYSCTAVLVSYSGQFGYLAHVSPTDRIYGERSTDLFGQILKQIRDKEIVKSQKPNLRFTIVAPSFDAVQGAVQTILQYGYFLSQIRVVVNPNALYADLEYDAQSDSARIFWKMGENASGFRMQQAWAEPSLEKGMLKLSIVPDLNRSQCDSPDLP